MRRRIRRHIRRKAAPKIRRCACAGAREGAKERMAGAGGLMIGGAKDPAEARADARAAKALSAAPTIHRKCADCEAVEARRRPAAGVLAPGKAAAPAPKAAETAVKALGAGRPLSAPEQAFYEPRLGADLSAVRLHENAAADAAAGAMDAAAFTLGRDIAFARGARSPALLAHELAHAAEDAPIARRTLLVRGNQLPIPQHPGHTLHQTVGEATQGYFDRICPDAEARIAPRGQVTFDEGFCAEHGSGPEDGCSCMCALINSRHTWRIIMRDSTNPLSDPRNSYDDFAASHSGRGGTGGYIFVPSPNEPREYGAARQGGAIVALENWEVLLHEMCGHATLADVGAHPRYYEHGRIVSGPEELRQGHGPVNERVNAIAGRIPGASGPPRGTSLRDAWCGESFVRERGTTDWGPPSHEQACAAARQHYLERMRRLYPDHSEFFPPQEFEMGDTLPPEPSQPAETSE